MEDARPTEARDTPEPSGSLRIPLGIRFSIADIAMFVIAAATASALSAEIYGKSKTWSMMQHDAPILAVLAIVLTAVALGAYKTHSAVQIFLQITLGCLGLLTLIWLAEAEQVRILIYWYQTFFALTVAGPMLARRFVKATMPRGPRRTLWKKTLEAVVFSFLNLHLVATGVLIQTFTIQIGAYYLS